MKYSEEQEYSIKIIVPYHKPDFLCKNSIFEPIHAGRALANLETKDGLLNQQEKQWMIQNMIGDNTGDNISHLNRYYSEMTAVYWAWKNYKKLGDPDFFGLNHYRRLFAFNIDNKNSEARYFPQRLDKNFFDSNCNEKTVVSAIKGYDLIIPKPYKLQERLRDAHARFHGDEDIRKCIAIVQKKFPSICKNMFDYFDEEYVYSCNMCIMQKDIFFEYCSFIFPVLDEVFADIRRQNLLEKKPRFIGYLAELLTGIFLYNAIQKNKYNYKELAVYYPRLTRIQLDLHPISSKHIPIAIYFEEQYKNLCYVLIYSIYISDQDQDFDIVLYGDSIKQESIFFFEQAVKHINNISIRFFDTNNLMQSTFYFLKNTDISRTNLYNLLVPFIFKYYETIISINSASVVCHNLSSIFSEDVAEHYIMATHDYSIVYIQRNILRSPIEYFNDTIFLEHPWEDYIQSNFIIFNIKKIIENKKHIDALSIYQINNFVFGYSDIANILFANNIKAIDSKWCVLTFEGTRKRFKNTNIGTCWQIQKWRNDAISPYIVCYSNGGRPDFFPEGHLSSLWWGYARKTTIYEILIKNMVEFHLNNKITIAKKSLPEKNERIQKKFGSIVKKIKNIVSSVKVLFVKKILRKKR